MVPESPVSDVVEGNPLVLSKVSYFFNADLIRELPDPQCHELMGVGGNYGLSHNFFGKLHCNIDSIIGRICLLVNKSLSICKLQFDKNAYKAILRVKRMCEGP